MGGEDSPSAHGVAEARRVGGGELGGEGEPGAVAGQPHCPTSSLPKWMDGTYLPTLPLLEKNRKKNESSE